MVEMIPPRFVAPFGVLHDLDRWRAVASAACSGNTGIKIGFLDAVGLALGLHDGKNFDVPVKVVGQPSSNNRPVRLFLLRVLDQCAPPNDKPAKLFSSRRRTLPSNAASCLRFEPALGCSNNDCGGGAKSILRRELVRRTGTVRSNRPAHHDPLGFFFFLPQRYRKKRSALFP